MKRIPTKQNLSDKRELPRPVIKEIIPLGHSMYREDDTTYLYTDKMLRALQRYEETKKQELREFEEIISLDREYYDSCIERFNNLLKDYQNRHVD